MAEGRAKIIIDADAAKVIAEAIKAGDAIEKAGKRARSFGRAIADSNRELAGTVVKTAVLLKTLDAVAETYEKFRKMTVDASGKIGGAELKAQLAGQRLGLSAEQSSGLLVGEGATTADERAGYLEKLAGMVGDKGAGNLTAESASRAAALFRTGLYREDELSDAIKKGTLGDLEADDRKSKLTGLARKEYVTRSYEMGLEQAGDRTRAGSGFGRRWTDADVEYDRARNPGRSAYFDWIGQVTAKAGGDKAIKYLERIAHSNDEMIRLSRTPVSGQPPE